MSRSIGLIWAASEHADAGGLVALFPFLPAHAGGVDILGQGTQGADRRPLPDGVLERVPGEKAGGVLPRDLVDLLVGAPGVLELLPGELRRVRPRRVRVGVVALPGDDVRADPVA